MKRTTAIAVLFACILVGALFSMKATALPPLLGHLLAGATAAPLKAADAQAIALSPVTAAQHSTKNLATSTTTASAHVVEPDSFSAGLAQEFTVKNLDGSIAVCLTISGRANHADTCALECALAAGVMTCEATAATTTGKYLSAGASYEVTITGKDCLCIESASGTPVVNIEQINRLP